MAGESKRAWQALAYFINRVPADDDLRSNISYCIGTAAAHRRHHVAVPWTPDPELVANTVKEKEKKIKTMMRGNIIELLVIPSDVASSVLMATNREPLFCVKASLVLDGSRNILQQEIRDTTETNNKVNV